MGFVDGRPHLYAKDEDGHQVFDLFIKKRHAKREYEDVRQVRITWTEELPERRGAEHG